MSFWRIYYRLYIESFYSWFGEKYITQGPDAVYDLIFYVTGYFMIFPTGMITCVLVELLGHPHGNLKTFFVLLFFLMNASVAYVVRNKLRKELYVERVFAELPLKDKKRLRIKSWFSLIFVMLPSVFHYGFLLWFRIVIHNPFFN